MPKIWNKRGDGICDPFAKLFFYFAGFNALYYFWLVKDDLQAGEEKQIHHLVGKFSQNQLDELESECDSAMDYFSEREFIIRMNKLPSGERKTQREGKSSCQVLKDSKCPADRIKALSSIIYIVRSNLFHGNKGHAGDDKEVIEQSWPSLRSFLIRALDHKQFKF